MSRKVTTTVRRFIKKRTLVSRIVAENIYTNNEIVVRFFNEPPHHYYITNVTTTVSRFSSTQVSLKMITATPYTRAKSHYSIQMGDHINISF